VSLARNGCCRILTISLITLARSGISWALVHAESDLRRAFFSLFTPRGQGLIYSSRPSVNCFASAADQVALYRNTVFEQGYAFPNITYPSDPRNHGALVSQQREHLAIFKAQSKACRYNMDVEDLKYMGTTTVARDVDYMARVFDGDSGNTCARSLPSMQT
jgi:hypothetical protein